MTRPGPADTVMPAWRHAAAGRPVLTPPGLCASRGPVPLRFVSVRPATGVPTIVRAVFPGEALFKPPPGRHPVRLGRRSPAGHLTAAMAPVALSTQGLVNYLQGLFGPLFLGIVGIVAIFFLFTREITRFVQFIVLAVAIAVIFYTPGIVHTLATGIANALGVH
jgi:hypothetical protein